MGRPVSRRFLDAFHGLYATYREEPNMRFHCTAAAGVAALAGAVGLEGGEGLYLMGTILLVLVAEAFNTALERAVDLSAATGVHPMARQAKDAAAGGVLLAVIHAALSGGYLFFVRRSPGETVAAAMAFASSRPGLAAGLAAGVLLVAVAGLLGGRERQGGRIG